MSKIDELIGKLKLPPFVVRVVRPLLEDALGDASQDALRKKFEKAAPKVVAQLAKDRAGDLGGRQLVRSAQFLLWKSVVKNGHAADAVRDAQDDKVVPMVLDRLPAGPPQLADVVRLTIEATLELTF